MRFDLASRIQKEELLTFVYITQSRRAIVAARRGEMTNKREGNSAYHVRVPDFRPTKKKNRCFTCVHTSLRRHTSVCR